MAKRLNGHLKIAQLKTLKNELLGEKERIINKHLSKEFNNSCRISEPSKDEVDSANNTILLSTELRFSNREQLYLKKIEKTLEFIQSDEYGICLECGAQISFARLSARPTSELCITCKEENEREEHQSVRVSKSLGQTVKL